MTGYTKLFHSILASTIWREDDKTRIVWITMLAMADKHGAVEAAIPGLADMARVSIAECEAALEKLSSPDKYSRTPDHEGRRIISKPGGWFILNHPKYREKMGADERREYLRLKQQEHRDREKAKRLDSSTGCQQYVDISTESTHAEAYTDANAGTVPPKSPGSAPPRGQAGGITEGKDSQNIPTTEQSKRIARIFHRRLTTPWTSKEIRAYRALGTIPEEDLSAVEKYYAANWPPYRNTNILRHDLLTFLNNFQGEVDRSKRQPAKSNASTTRIANETSHRATGAANFTGRYAAPPPVWQEPPIDGKGTENPQPTPEIPSVPPGAG